MQSLYAQLQAAGCKIDNHESDLYVKNSPEARAIIEHFEAEGGITNKSYFRSQIDGGSWIDLPFAYLPWWEARQARA